jgi:UDP-3-O-[3-hydroxymyristoyl] N-acetylglucosamine deacetylase
MLTEIIQTSEPQTTVAEPIHIQGHSSFDLMPTSAIILPAQTNQGLVFLVDGHPIHYDHLSRLDSPRCDGPDLSDGDATVRSVGHLTSALWGLGCDNAVIETINGSIPGREYSAAEYCRAIESVGLNRLTENRRRLAIRSPGRIAGTDGAFIELRPASTLRIEIVHDFPPPLGLQTSRYTEGETDFTEQIAWARGFGPTPSPLGDPKWGHLTAMNPETLADAEPFPAVFFSKSKILTKLRRKDEPGCHLMLDFIGQLAALGIRPLGQFIVYRPDTKLTRELLAVLAGASSANRLRGDSILC